MNQGRTMIYVCFGVAAFLGLTLLAAVDAGAAADENPVVVIDTSAGPITIELDAKKAPITVDNFLKYVDAGFYDNLIFHRVIETFMIQGGGFDDKMREKSDGLRGPIKNEGSNGLVNKPGTIAMARTSRPDSATCQFFINTEDNSRKLCPGGVDPYGYAVFGHVTSGMEAVNAIAKVPTGQRGPHGDVPVTPVYIKSIKRKGK